MKKVFVYSLLTILVITGCQTKELETVLPENNDETIIQEGAKVFTAIIDNDFNVETRTSLDGEGNVLWKQGDQVSIFAGSTVNEHYQVTDASDGKTAASLNKVDDGGFVAGTEIDNNVAFYPYASTAEIAKSGSNYVIREIELPATQTYAEGSFGNGAFPMVAVTSSSEDMNLKFKNILGGLKLQLKGTATIASITITGKNNEKLCGDAEVTVTSGGTPSISLNDADAKTLTLNCGAGVALNTETATPFIIALPPITMTGGFTVVVTDTEGKQMEISTSKSQTITRSNLLRMPAVNYVGTAPIDYLAEPFTITSTGSTSVALNKYGTPANVALEYRKNGGDWTSYTFGSTIDLTDGESLQFRADEDGNDTFSKDNVTYYYFRVTGTGTIIASGNIMSLLDRSLERTSVPQSAFRSLFRSCTKLVGASELKLPATTLADYCYCYMFERCSNLTIAPELPATTLADRCYYYMFNGCTGLTSAPELPATTLAAYCYGGMFVGCTGLTSAPELPATTLADRCYYCMFGYCTSLTSAPILPATTLATYCYNNMFVGCTGLTSAPKLPATTMATYCYDNMFNGCTGLTSAPELPATTLATSCYREMFSCCTGLTSAPELPATTLEYACYNYMFKGCTGLTSASELPATTLATSCYTSMFQGCTGLTSAPKLPATTLAPGCYGSMFSDCTGLTSAPKLPATTLADDCYSGMFIGCTGLTSAPELPATTLATSCYTNMFYGCSKLNYIKMLATDISATDCLDSWVSGVSATGTFVKSSSATWDRTGSSGVPSGWTVETE